MPKLRLRLLGALAALTVPFLTSCSNKTFSPAHTLALTPSILTSPGSRIPYGGKPEYLLGVNYAWNRYGDDFGGNPEASAKDWAQIESDFATMHKQGVRVVRWWVFADGRSEPRFDARGDVTGLGPGFFPDLDHGLQIASSNNISLILTLTDSSMFYLNKDPKTGGGGHQAIVLENFTQESYYNKALKPLVVHLAGSPYKSDIAGIDLINEPEGCTSGFYGTNGLGDDAMRAFIETSAEYVHFYGKGLYVTVGSAAPYWVRSWYGLGLDFYSAHYYPQMDQRDMLAHTQAPGNGLATYASLNLDRPCILEEFATAARSYGPDDTQGLSAKWYLDQAEKRGYAGALGWSYGVPDKASNWAKFAPIFTAWQRKHAAELGD